MAKQAWYKRLWMRLIITTFLLLLITFCVGLIIWGSNSSSNDIALALLAGISALVGAGQWIFPFSSKKTEQFVLPYAHELRRDNVSFRMGDITAANFDYITEPIKNDYDTAKQALLDASSGLGSKHGILVLGIANSGKTRLAFEVLTQTLPDWKVLIWNPAYDTPSKVPSFTSSPGSNLVVFIDDLQEYVPPESYDVEIHAFFPDNRIATLQAFLNNMHKIKRLVIIATCRLEDETRVAARLRWLFDQLKIILLRSFEITDPESAHIIDLFQRHGATEVSDWDGTLGSLVLGLSKKRSQYENLVQSHHPAVLILRAMKLLSLALITVHTNLRVQSVCAGVFGEVNIQEGSKTWQDSVDQLTRLEFVTEVKDRSSSSFALIIRKDTYFDKVIIDYPLHNRPYQLDQHFEKLQNVLVRLNDSSAVVDLANALDGFKRHDEALVAYDEAIRLDPKHARAYIGKGRTLVNLKRYDEALDAYDEAIRLDPKDAVAYNGKGIALSDLKRYDEALVAFEQAIHLGPTNAGLFMNRGIALSDLKRYDEALVAFEQAIRFDPTDALIYYNKGVALDGFKRYDEALDAYDEAIRLDPKHTRGYIGKGETLVNLERYDEALDTCDEAIRLDPRDAVAHNLKGKALRDLKRYDEALGAYGEAIRLDPTNADVYNNKGITLGKLGHYDEAVAAFEQAIHLNPTNADAYYNKGVVLFIFKRYDEALAAFEQAIHLGPRSVDACNNKGSVLSSLERHDEAVAAFEQAISLDPTNSLAHTEKEKLLQMPEHEKEA